MTALASVLRFEAEPAGFGNPDAEGSGLHLVRSDSARSTTLNGKYRLDAEIGEGGMGVVWRAFNVQLEVPVAIKLLRPGLYSTELGERLRTEARAAAQLAHPAIVRVFDVGESEAGEPFIVMELLNGESLGDVMERGPLSAIGAVQLLLPIAEGLAVAHSHGVVHRDLKPDNIFITLDGGVTQPKLLDFGIAKLTSNAGSTAKLTQMGQLLGSPDYMSPEQARGLSDVDQRSDIWSLCVVLYEALSGQAPFVASNCQALLCSIIEDEPLPLESFAGIDAKLSALVQRGLEKDRDRRYSSVSELGHALASWLAEQGVREDVTGAFLAAKWLGRSSDSLPILEAPPSGTPDVERTARRRWRWIPKALAAMIALAGAGLGGSVLASSAVGPTPSAITWAPSGAAPASTLAIPLPIASEAPRVVPELPSAPPAPAPAKLDGSSRVRTAKLAPSLPQPASDPKRDLMDPYR